MIGSTWAIESDHQAAIRKATQLSREYGIRYSVYKGLTSGLWNVFPAVAPLRDIS